MHNSNKNLIWEKEKCQAFICPMMRVDGFLESYNLQKGKNVLNVSLNSHCKYVSFYV